MLCRKPRQRIDSRCPRAPSAGWCKRTEHGGGRLKESPFLSTYDLTPLVNEAFPEVAVHRSKILPTLHSLGLPVESAIAAARFTEEQRAALRVNQG
jgi:hypothetical protein